MCDCMPGRTGTELDTFSQNFVAIFSEREMIAKVETFELTFERSFAALAIYYFRLVDRNI